METRPESPDRDLLDRARSELGTRLSVDTSGMVWVVGERMERKRSTLFHLTLRSSEVAATAYYKAPYYPEEKQDSRHLQRAREALARNSVLADRFAELAKGSGVSINVTLASNPETLESVTLGLEGAPMGDPLRLMTSKSKREEAITTCRRVGNAVRILESIDDLDPDSPDEILKSAGRKLESTAGYLSDEEIRHLEARLRGLFSSATAEQGGVVVAHGDLSPGNVIMMDDETGLIDFLWLTQLKGYDLSRYVHRLRYSAVSYRPWTEKLVTAAMEGYGDASVTSSAGWQFSKIMHMLTTVQRLDRRGQMERGPGKRALEGLRASTSG